MTKQQRLHPRNSTPLLLVALLALAPTPSGAFVLGEPVPLSRIGEPLRIEIPVLQGAPAQVAECLRPAAPSAASDGLPQVRNARIDLAGRAPDVRLVLSHRLPSFDPALRFAIEDICDSRLRREYTVLLAFPDDTAAAAKSAGAQTQARSGGTPTEAPAQEAPRRARPSRRTIAASDAPAAASTASASPARATAPSARGGDRLELGGGESETPGAGLRLSTQLGSLARIDATTEAQREQLRREQSVIMAIDRTIVAQLELNERIRQLEAAQARLMAEHVRPPAAGTTPVALPAETEKQPAPKAEPIEPDHSVAEAWKQGTLTVGFVSLALAAVLAWIHKRREKAPPAEDEETKPRSAPATKKPLARPSAARTEPIARPAPVSPAPALPPDLRDLTSDVASELEPARRPPERSPLGWNTEEDAFAHPISLAPIAPIAPIDPIAPIAPVMAEESAEEHESAIELAEIMMGFGRIRGAADTLAEFIASNPKKAVTPWLKLMEVYRAADLREEFDALAKQLNKTFNVKAVTWESFEEARAATNSMEQMAHVTKNVQQMWGTPDCQAYLEHLLRDNRDGTREGFPLSVIDEILLLEAILDDQLGPYRPDTPPLQPAGGDPSREIPPQLV